MPRIMGIGNVSGLSRKHKPKRAGSFKGMGIILEGDPKRLRGLGKKKSLRGLGLTPSAHADRAAEGEVTIKELLEDSSCPKALYALFAAGQQHAHATSSGKHASLDNKVRATAAVRRFCGCR